jgi:uncharacterized protein YbgA (DUF1722 family)/uncharacterized protein YbbK (DUF523 family)
MIAGASRHEPEDGPSGGAAPTAASSRGGAAADGAAIRVGISSCLLGEEVRFDGGHKRDRFITDTLAEFVTFVPVCPEMEIGLGSPRESMHLEVVGGEVRLITTKTRQDLTERMSSWAARRIAQLAAMDLCGYILKKDSPSCGMERVRVYGRAGTSPSKQGRGVFAAALLDTLDSLPVEEEGRLQDPHLRENFFVRVFAYRRVKSLFAEKWRLGDLVAFHAAEKLLLRAHDTAGLRELGRLVAEASRLPPAEVAVRYRSGFLAALRKRATVKKVAGVLENTAGHLREVIDDDSRRELHAVIDDYRRGFVPLVVPLTLIRHHARHHGVATLAGQTFIEPHPKELMLRNHV